MPLTTIGKAAQTRSFQEDSYEKQNTDSISLLPYPYFMKVLRRILNGWTDLQEEIFPIAKGTVQVALADLGADLRKMCFTLNISRLVSGYGSLFGICLNSEKSANNTEDI